MNKKLIGFALAIFAALGAVNAQGEIYTDERDNRWTYNVGLTTLSGEWGAGFLSNYGTIINEGQAGIGFINWNNLIENTSQGTMYLNGIFGGVINNYGTLNLELLPSSNFSGINEGTINLEYGSLSATLQNDGVLNLNRNKNINIASTLVSNGLSGNGTINNTGWLATESITGNQTINNSGRIDITGGCSTTHNIYESFASTLSFCIENTGSHGTFTANHINLDGTLELDLTNYTPTLGETIRLILAHDFTGAFTNYRVLGKPQFTLTTNVVSLTNGSYAFDVNIVPIPASVWMLLSGLGGLGLLGRKRKGAK